MGDHLWRPGTRVIWTGNIERPKATIVRYYRVGQYKYQYVINIDGRFGDEYVLAEELELLTVLDLMIEE